MLHVPTTPIPESTGIPEWSLTDEHHHSHHHQPPQQPHHHDNDYFQSTEDNFFFLQQQQQQRQQSVHDHDVALPPPPPLSPQGHLQQPPPQLPPPLLEPGLGEEDMMMMEHEHHLFNSDDYHHPIGMDHTYETATRIFYATMEKFTKQGYHRRSFLESWHLHSMYSKSQQILLGIPNAQSMVFLSGDDFMFTPQLVPQEMEFDWEDQNQPLGIDEGVMVMTAPAPEMMDENSWMRQQHHLLEEDDELLQQDDHPPHIAPITTNNNTAAPDLQHHHHHQIDLVNWYRAGNNNPPPAPPSTIMEIDDAEQDNSNNDHEINNSPLQPNIEPNSIGSETIKVQVVDDEQKEEDEGDDDDEDQTVEEMTTKICNNQHGEKGKEIIRINAEEYISSIEKDLSIHDVEECNVYQSLADMMPPPITSLPSSTTASTHPLPKTTTVGRYGTIAEQSLFKTYHTKERRQKQQDLTEKLLEFPFLRSSDRLTNAVLEAFELAEQLVSSKVTFFGCLLYFFRIWQVLFLCAESLISIRRSPPLVPPYYRKSSLRMDDRKVDDMV